MRMFMYSVEKREGGPRAMFATFEEAEAQQQPDEYVIEYKFTLEDSVALRFPSRVVLTVGEE